MELWRARSRLPDVLDALGRPEADPATRRLADAFGPEVAVRERLVGEPARRSRRVAFASGGEIILHDDAVVAVLLHLVSTPNTPRGLDLSDWVTGVGNGATLEDLTTATGAPRRFAGFGTPYLTLAGGYARLDFRDRRGWNDPGNLLGITVTAERPGLTCRPEDDDCPTCSDLLVRRTDVGGGVDVEATVSSLTTAVTAGSLTEDAHWVRLVDLQPLHASGLMERVESQLTCTTCRRIICFTLLGDAPPTFTYTVLDEARQRRLGAIPPVEQWGDPARIAEARETMQYLDHEPGAWFLLQQQGTLYLHARYVISTMVDDSALIRLDESEREAYRTGGRDSVARLARRIHDGSPHREESPFHRRDLLRGPDRQEYADAVARAIVNHTWLAEQRRR